METSEKTKAVKPIIANNQRPGKTIFNQWYACGNCEYPINPDDIYCSHCGVEIDHDFDR